MRRGIGGSKNAEGRKRHFITDTIGLTLAIVVHSANEHNSKSALEVNCLMSRNLKMRKYLLIIIIVITTLSCNKYTGFKRISLISEAIEVSYHKPVMLIVTNKDCEACELIEYQIYKNNKLMNEVLNEFELLKYDNEDKKINKILKISAFPTFVIFNKGKVVQSLNYGIIESFLFHVRNFDAYERMHNYNSHKLFGLGQDKENILESIDLLIEAICEQESNKSDSENILHLLERSHQTSPYFYNTFLLAMQYHRMNNTAKADSLIIQLNKNINGEDNFLYRDEIVEMLSLKGSEHLLAELFLEKSKHEFGKIQENTAYHCFFPIKNIGKSSLIIYDLTTTCGCTITESPKKPILPGQKDSIRITFNSSRTGYFTKKIFINCNGVKKNSTLIINGLIK